MTLDAGFGPRPDPAASEPKPRGGSRPPRRSAPLSTRPSKRRPCPSWRVSAPSPSTTSTASIGGATGRARTDRGGVRPRGGPSTRDAPWTPPPPNREEDLAPFQRVRQRAIDRSTARVRAAIEHDPRPVDERRWRTVRTETRVGTGRTESPTRTGDAKSRANASTARPPPRRERAEAGYYPASYRVALSSGGRDTTASCALRAAPRRAESPTVRAVPPRGASSHDCGADEREDAIGARETRGTRSSGRGETRARRGSDARDDAELACSFRGARTERRATGTSRPTSHLPEVRRRVRRRREKMGALIETRSDTALAATARFVDDKYSFRTLAAFAPWNRASASTRRLRGDGPARDGRQFRVDVILPRLPREHRAQRDDEEDVRARRDPLRGVRRRRARHQRVPSRPDQPFPVKPACTTAPIRWSWTRRTSPWTLWRGRGGNWRR